MPTKLFFTVETVSPVHIGLGKEYIGGRDFTYEGGSLIVLDRDALYRKASADPKLYDTLLKSEERYGFFIKKQDLNPLDFALFKVGSQTEITGFQPLFRDARGNPVIPSSSMKGAIRTALMWAQAHEEGRVKEGFFLSEEGKRALENLMADVPRNPPQKQQTVELSAGRLEGSIFTGFRRRPGDLDNSPKWDSANADLMRAFLPQDALPQEPLTTAIEEMRVLSLSPRGGYHWKNAEAPSQKLAVESKEPLSYFLETIPPKSKFSFSITLNEDFLDQGKFGALGLYRDVKRRTVKMWLQETLIFASETANEEMQFFADLGVRETAFFYQDLVDAISEADEKTTTFLRLGRGIGWNALTGRFLRGENLRRARAVVPELTGRENMPFPKTKKVFVSADGKASSAPGWIKLTLEQ